MNELIGVLLLFSGFVSAYAFLKYDELQLEKYMTEEEYVKYKAIKMRVIKRKGKVK